MAQATPEFESPLMEGMRRKARRISGSPDPGDNAEMEGRLRQEFDIRQQVAAADNYISDAQAKFELRAQAAAADNAEAKVDDAEVQTAIPPTIESPRAQAAAADNAEANALLQVIKACPYKGRPLQDPSGTRAVQERENMLEFITKAKDAIRRAIQSPNNEDHKAKMLALGSFIATPVDKKTTGRPYCIANKMLIQEIITSIHKVRFRSFK